MAKRMFWKSIPIPRHNMGVKQWTSTKHSMGSRVGWALKQAAKTYDDAGSLRTKTAVMTEEKQHLRPIAHGKHTTIYAWLLDDPPEYLIGVGPPRDYVIGKRGKRRASRNIFRYDILHGPNGPLVFQDEMAAMGYAHRYEEYRERNVITTKPQVPWRVVRIRKPSARA